METSLLFLHHSSFLIRHGSELLLTDPLIWTGPKHLTYLSKIDNLNVLITHKNENHLSMEDFKIFHPSTTFIIGYLSFKEISAALKALGFRYFINGNDYGVDLGSFHLKIFERPCKDREWITYSVRTKKGLIVYNNDSHYPVRQGLAAIVKLEMGKVPSKNAVVMSGHNAHLSLSQFLKFRKNAESMGVRKMVVQGRPEFLHLIERSEVEVVVCEVGDEVVLG